MLSFAYAIAASTVLGAICSRAQLVNADVEVAIGDSAMCPLPTPATVNAQVLAVVQFDETVEIDLLGLPAVDVTAAVNICLCVEATVQTGIPISAEVAAAAILPIRLGIEASTDALLAPAQNLLGLGGTLSVSVQPTDGEVTDTCRCAATAIPTCSNGQCGCTPCDDPAAPVYDPLTQACGPCPFGYFFSETAQACILSPSGSLRKMRRSQPEIERRQATRQSIVDRLRA